MSFAGVACVVRTILIGVVLGLIAGVFLAIKALRRQERHGWLVVLALGFNAVPLVLLVGSFVLAVVVPALRTDPPSHQPAEAVNQGTNQTTRQSKPVDRQGSPTDPQREPAPGAAGPIAKLPAGTLLYAAATTGEIRRLGPEGQKLPSLVGTANRDTQTLVHFLHLDAPFSDIARRVVASNWRHDLARSPDR